MGSDDWVIEPAAQAAVAVAGGGRFPVRRIYCVGRNYADHAREMGSDPNREAPFFFSKPASAVIQQPVVPWPPMTDDLHHEVELVVAISGSGAELELHDAMAQVFGYSVGVDLTRRDLQAAAKEKSRPWDMAKGFDHSAPIANIVRAADWTLPLEAPITLSVNDEARQTGDISQMIWSIPEIICELSRYVELGPGDLIFTGTPSGVSALRHGDAVEARVGEGLTLNFTMQGLQKHPGRSD